MCMASSVGFVLLTVSFLACGVGFLSPHWVYYPSRTIDRIRIEYEGMLARRLNGGYVWFWQNSFAMEQEVKEWHKAAQALYSFGYVILLSTVLLSLLHLCCRCCCRRPFSLATVIGSLIIAGSVLVSASIGVFMVFQFKENDVILETPGAEDSGSARFEWGCFVAVGGIVCALLASIFFICEGCHSDSRAYDGYETARTV